jgi:hypothetical protein
MRRHSSVITTSTTREGEVATVQERGGGTTNLVENKPSPIREAEDRNNLRIQIQAILEDGTIPLDKKPHHIQALMSRKCSHPCVTVIAESEQHDHRENDLTEEALKKHYANGDSLGCKHYQCGSKVKAPCCRKWYVCRLCHDEAEQHTMDRYAVKEMLCMLCSHVQPPAQCCAKCQTKLGRYYCNECKLWDDDPTKEVYHCPDCKLCRRGIGLGVDYYHCDKCQTCLSVKIKDTHRCTERLLDCNCPICGDYLFTSRESIGFLACGHPIHVQCVMLHTSKFYRCPICFKTVADTTQLFQRMEKILEEQPMPPEFANITARILCNDCHKENRAPYHFLYHKCIDCQSFNTRLLDIIRPASPGPSDSANGNLADPEDIVSVVLQTPSGSSSEENIEVMASLGEQPDA